MDVAKGAIGLLTEAIKVSASVSQIGTLPTATDLIPHSIVLMCHCLAVAGLTKGRYSGQLLSFVQGFLMAFGGSVCSNIFLATPAKMIVFSEASNQVLLTWALAWWIVNHNPFSIVDDFLDLAPVGTICRACVQILRSSLVCAQVGAAAAAFPGKVAPAIIAGTLAGCGGKICTDVVSAISGLRTSFELAHPTYSIRSSVVGATICYLTVHVLGALKPAEGLGVVMLTFIAHPLTDDVMGAPIDVTVSIFNAFTIVTFIGDPPAPAGRGARGRSRTPAPAVAAAEKSPTTPRSTSKARATRKKRSE